MTARITPEMRELLELQRKLQKSYMTGFITALVMTAILAIVVATHSVPKVLAAPALVLWLVLTVDYAWKTFFSKRARTLRRYDKQRSFTE